MTQLCVAIFVDDVETARRDIARAAEEGADLVELRVDTMVDPPMVKKLVAESILPLRVSIALKAVAQQGRSTKRPAPRTVRRSPSFQASAPRLERT